VPLDPQAKAVRGHDVPQIGLERQLMSTVDQTHAEHDQTQFEPCATAPGWFARWSTVCVALALAMVPESLAIVHAQAPSATAPQGRRGATRTADGKPDLNGVWQVMNTAHVDLEPHHARPGMPGGLGVVDGGEIPYQPWALAKRKEHVENRASQDPLGKCFLPGVPRATYLPYPFQIAQTAKHLAISHEFAHTMRIIYTDGTPHPGPLDFWMGDSRGKWEGDTLVVDTTHFNDRTWFDMSGNFHSEALHVIERFTPSADGQRMQYDVTIDDAKVFTRPWKMSMPIYRRAERNLQIVDYDCVDFFWQDQLDKK
jgi:hypothetical protein